MSAEHSASPVGRVHSAGADHQVQAVVLRLFRAHGPLGVVLDVSILPAVDW